MRYGLATGARERAGPATMVLSAAVEGRRVVAWTSGGGAAAKLGLGAGETQTGVGLARATQERSTAVGRARGREAGVCTADSDAVWDDSVVKSRSRGGFGRSMRRRLFTLFTQAGGCCARGPSTRFTRFARFALFTLFTLFTRCRPSSVQTWQPMHAPRDVQLHNPGSPVGTVADSGEHR